jgi:carbon storage regulator
MLVLTRKDGQDITIGQGIVVRVIQARDGRVKLGIAAPRDVEVHRGEVRARIDAAGGGHAAA